MHMSNNQKFSAPVQLLIGGSKPNSLRTISDPRFAAQSSALCVRNSVPGTSQDPLFQSLDLLKQRSQKLYLIAHLQFVHGLRISEVLDIKHSDISPQGFIKIGSKKMSSGRIIHAGESLEYMHQCRASLVHPFAGFDRFFVYREYKRVGLMKFVPGNKKASVTHLFRHNASSQALKVGADIETRAHQLGHKSTKSTQHYGR